MSYAKHVPQPPPFDAAAAAKAPTGKAWEKFAEWKRWVEATGTQDGRGMRDVVEANAIGLDKLKAQTDAQADQHARLQQQVNQLSQKVASLETMPPFPA